MAISTFDTLKFVRRLEAAGVPAQQAEVQAEVPTEAFNVNLDALVTKDYLAARFAEQNTKINSNHRIFVWTQAVIMAAVILPLLERWLAFG